MPKYRVRDGQQLPHNGEVLEAGAEVALSRGLAYEVRHLVVEVNEAGEPVTTLVPAWHAALGNRPDREQAFALQETRAAAAAKVDAAVLVLDARVQEVARARADVDAATAELADIDSLIEEYLATPAPVHEPPSVPVRRIDPEPEPADAVADAAGAGDAQTETPNPEAADTNVRPSTKPRTNRNRS